MCSTASRSVPQGGVLGDAPLRIGGNRYEAGDDLGSFAGDVASACTGRWAKSSYLVRPSVLQARRVLRPHPIAFFSCPRSTAPNVFAQPGSIASDRPRK